MKFRKYVDKYLFASLAMWLAAFIIYVNYYDILIPGIQDGSYRAVVGLLFIIPSFILSMGQVLIGAFMVFLFSLTYVLFPFYGPFYFIAFATNVAPPGVLLVEVVWTAALLGISTMLLHRLQKVSLGYALFTAGVTGIFIVVAAS